MGKRIVIWAALMVSVLLNVYLIGCHRWDRCYRGDVGTVYVYDTIHIGEPVPMSDEVVAEEVVRLPKAKDEQINIPICNELERNGGLPNGLSNELAPDTNAATKTAIEDSVAVIIPISEKDYGDSTYKAVIRGYNPELVSLEMYQSTITKTITKTKKPRIIISAGVYGGFGVKGADWGLGISVGVPIWSW